MGSDSSQEDQEVGSGKVCTNAEHAFQQIFKCDQMNCEQFCCKQCIGKQDGSGKRFCVLCTANLQDEDQVDLSGGSGKVIGEFTKTLAVKRDKETGEVIGWDDFFAHIA